MSNEPTIPEILRAVNLLKVGWACPIDEGLIEPRVTYNSEVEIYCLSCYWSKIIGPEYARHLVEPFQM